LRPIFTIFILLGIHPIFHGYKHGGESQHLYPSISHIPIILMAGQTPIWITFNSYILMISPMTRHP
jgi:hypothetical protein